MKQRKTLLFLIAIIGWTLGCADGHKYSDLAELREQHSAKPEPVALLTKDSALYRFTYFRIEDTALMGVGTVERHNKSTVFEGIVPMKDIRYIEASNISALKTAIAVLSAGVVVGFAATALHPQSGVTATEQTHYIAPYSGGGSGSCPLLYSWDGTGYHFETDAAGAGVTKQLLCTTTDPMYRIKAVNDQYKLLLSQDAPEDDHVDQISLVAIDHKPSIRLIADAANVVHTVRDIVPPKTAMHERMGDCTALLATADGKHFESDLRSNPVASASDLKDRITMTFPRPSNAGTTAKIVVCVKNTGLTNYAYDILIGLSGRNRLHWFDELDRDAKESQKLADFIHREGGLHVEVLEADGWHEQVVLPDPGVRYDRWQVATLDLSRAVGSDIQLRVSCTTDLMSLDLVGLDFSTDDPLTMTPLRLLSATMKDGTDVTSLIASTDDRFVNSSIGDSTFLTFKAPSAPPAKGLDRSIFAKTIAYFHEWYYTDGDDRSAYREAVYAIPGLGAMNALPEWKKMWLAEHK